MRVLTIPLRTHSAGIDIQLPDGTLTPADWDVFMAVLDAMRPALVHEPSEAAAAIIANARDYFDGKAGADE